MSSAPSTLTVPELRARLADRGLVRTGRKADLVARLLASAETAELPRQKETASEAGADGGPTVSFTLLFLH
jgi:hypothetical protein